MPLDPLDLVTELAHSERASLVALARKEGLSPEEAIDCVHDALCTLLSRPLEAENLDHARASLLLITRNAARNTRRLHRLARPHEALENDDPVSLGKPDVESLVAHAEDVVRLRACVAELCTIQRSVVTLRLLDERSGEDVASELGITRAHVDVLVHRAKSSLRVCMNHHAARLSVHATYDDSHSR